MLSRRNWNLVPYLNNGMASKSQTSQYYFLINLYLMRSNNMHVF